MALAVGLVILMYWDVFDTLIQIWSVKEEYGHGFMIPVIALYFIWQKKQIIQKEKLAGSWAGVAIIIFAMSGYFIGTVGDVDFLLRFSFIFTLLGLSLAIAGYKVTQIILIPILILIFSFPLPPVLQAELTSELQLISSKLGVAVIRFCDIPVYLEGNIIDLGNYQLQVVEACSGLNYLFPLMSLAFICAYMFQVVFWKRTLLFLSSIPLTILMNSFRIGVVGILIEYWGIEMAEGFIHDFEGWIIFMGCLIILIFEMWLLSWYDRKKHGWDVIFNLNSEQSLAPSYKAQFSNTFPLVSVTVLMLVATIFINPLTKRVDIIPPRQTFKTFPLQLAEFTGKTASLETKTTDFLGLTDYLLIDFRNKQNKHVNFYVAYYQTQKDGAVPHSPKLCIPGGGWQIMDLSETEFDQTIFNRVVIKMGKNEQLVYYWYQQRGQSIASEYALKWHTFLGALNHQRTDGALIRLTTRIQLGEDIAAADNRLQQFMLLINNQLAPYIPN
ncbi:MAG: VPLPA-CTERM-specific exosortase XrtD [Methylococcales bacterium]|nr:VPLPA-CTERM-specific exosortase XrtD [Methylococcales bacterium]